MAKINVINNQSAELTIDPGASGDSFVQFDINGTGEFKIGVDDTDSDKFKISQGSALGSNDTFIITAAGERTMPLTPAFSASSAASQTNATGDGTVATVVFGTEVFDQGSNFDGTSTFTAPITGIYRFSTNLLCEDIVEGTHNDCIAYFSATGGDYRFFKFDFVAGTVVSPDQRMAIPGCAIIKMTAADTVVVKIDFAGGTKVIDILASGRNTIFMGNLIC